MSIETFSFFNRFANFVNSLPSTSSGLPTKATILGRWFFPCRCFNANWRKTKFIFDFLCRRLTFATLIPLQKSSLPSIGNRCNLEKILPTSAVNCVTTRPLKKKKTISILFFEKEKISKFYSESVNNPTWFSGFDLVLAWNINETASCCACMRVGIKSPSRIKSLLSTLKRNEEKRRTRRKNENDRFTK